MADAAVAISAGTGTNIDTRTEGTNGNHRQVVVVGDPATNAGVAPVDATAGLKVDLGADNDITGTVTANLGATDNAVIDAIQAATEATQAAVEGTLTVGSHAVTNAGTFATQITGDALTSLQLTDDTVYVDDADWTDNTSKHNLVGGVYQTTPHTVTDGDVTPFLTDANGRLIVAATDNGGALTVDGTVTANLSATDNAVLDAIVVDTGEIQTAVEAIQAGQLADGHNVTIDNSTGAAAVNIQDGGNTITVDGTVAVTNAALTELAAAINTDKLDVNIKSSDVATGGTSAADDADFTAGTTTGTPAMGIYESTPTSVTDGDMGVAGLTSTRALKVQAQANGGVDIGDVTINNATIAVTQSGTWDEVGINDSGNSITVDGTVTADLGATDNAVLDAIAASTAAIETAVEGTLTVTGGGGGVEYTEGDTDATITGSVAMMEVAGDAIQPIQGTVAGGLLVNLGSNNDVTVTGTVDLGATDNAVLDNIDADLTTIIGHVDGIEGSVDGIEALLTTIDADTSNLSVVGGGTEAAALRVTIANNSTGVVSVDDNGGALTVDGTVTANLSATDNAVLDTIDAVLDTINAKLVTGTDIGDVTINNGSGASAVNIQDGGNTITVDGTVTANLSATDNTVLDNIEAGIDELKTGVVLAAGTNGIGKLTANSGVDIGDVTLTAGTAAIGSLLPSDTDVTAHTNYARKYYTSAGAATDGIIWSPAAGKRWHVVTMYINVSAAATVTLEDDKAGGDDPVWKGELAANSGVVLQFPEKYPMASGEDAADLLVTTTGANIYITCVGYEV